MSNLITLKNRIHREFALFIMTANETLDAKESNILDIFAVVAEIDGDAKVSFAVFVDSGNGNKALYPLNKPRKSSEYFSESQLNVNEAGLLTIESLEYGAMATLRRIQALSTRADTKKPMGFRIYGSFTDKKIDGVVLYHQDNLSINAAQWAKEICS